MLEIDASKYIRAAEKKYCFGAMGARKTYVRSGPTTLMRMEIT